MANVNGKIILLSDLRNQMAMLRSLKNKNSANIMEENITERKVLQMMIDEKIMTHYARESNITIKESEIDKAVENVKTANGLTDKTLISALEHQGVTLEKYRETLRNQMLIQRITSFEITGVNVTDDEVKDYYEQNINEFMTQEKVRMSHIAIEAPESAGPAKSGRARTKIQSIMNEIQNGAEFAALARKYSQDASAENGGDLGWFLKGRMLPAFEKIAFAFKKGEVGGPIRTPYGFHLIKVTDRVEPEPIPLKQAAEGIRSRLRNSAFLRKRTAWLERLRDQSYIEILY